MSDSHDCRGRAWALLLATQARVVARAESALAEAGLPPLAWYDLLWELEKADSGRLRMHELAERLVLSRSNVTRLADRVQKAGLVRREPCSDDRRGFHCVLTPAGRVMRRRMWPIYRDVIERCFAAPLRDAEAAAMVRGLERVLRPLQPGRRS